MYCANTCSTHVCTCVPDNAKLIEISSSPFRSKRFLECDGDIVYVVSVPQWTEDWITESTEIIQVQYKETEYNTYNECAADACEHTPH